MSTATATFFHEFTKADRCDSCGAEAKAAASKGPGTITLFFCGHHIRKNEDALTRKGWSVLHSPQA